MSLIRLAVTAPLIALVALAAFLAPSVHAGAQTALSALHGAGAVTIGANQNVAAIFGVAGH